MAELGGGQLPALDAPARRALPEPAELLEQPTIPAGLSTEEFVGRCREAGIDLNRVAQVRAHRYGERELSDADRAELWSIVALLDPDDAEPLDSDIEAAADLA